MSRQKLWRKRDNQDCGSVSHTKIGIVSVINAVEQANQNLNRWHNQGSGAKGTTNSESVNTTKTTTNGTNKTTTNGTTKTTTNGTTKATTRGIKNATIIVE